MIRAWTMLRKFLIGKKTACLLFESKKKIENNLLLLKREK